MEASEFVQTRGELTRSYLLKLVAPFWRVPGVCWLLHKWLGETLSGLVSKQFEEYKRKLRSRVPLHERLCGFKYVATAFFLPIVVLLVVGVLGKSGDNTQDAKSFLSTLHTCAAVVASFTAILITIIIFTVTVNSAYVARASSLFEFYLRRLYFKPVLAFAAGVAGACLVGGVLFSYFPSWSAASVTVLVFLGYGVIGLDVLLLFRAVRKLARSSISQLLAESYVAEHRRSLLAHVKRTLAQGMHASILNSLGFWCNPFGLYDDSECIEYTVKSGGLFVNDVYLDYLKKLGENWQLKSLERKDNQSLISGQNEAPNIRIWPGQKLPEKKDCFGAMQAKQEEKDGHAHTLFEMAYVCGRRDQWDVPVVEWSEISYLLKTLIRDKDTEGVTSVLDAFRSIVGDYLETRRAIQWPHKAQTLEQELMSPYRAPTLRNVDFESFIKLAITNEDEECLEQISGFLYQIADTAFNFENSQYFDEVLIRLNWLYEFSRTSERMAEFGTGTVVRRYENIQHIFEYALHRDEEKPSTYSKLVPFIERFLKSILNTMRQAARYSDDETFRELLKRANSLLGHCAAEDRGELEYYGKHEEKCELLKVKQRIRDIRLLCNLVISAWLYRGVKQGEYKREIVKPLIHASVDQISDFRTLVETYLFAKKIRRRQSGLEYDWWDVVPGVAWSGDAFSLWIEPFWVVVALMRGANEPSVNVKRIRLVGHVSELDCKRVSDRIDQVLNEETHRWFTGEVELRRGKAPLLGVLSALALRQRRTDYEEIIAASIDENALIGFRERCLEGYRSKAKLRGLLAKYGRSTQQENGTVAKGLGRLRHYVDKEDLTSERRDTGLAAQLGEWMGREETLHYSGVIEENLRGKGYIKSFEELETRIKSEAKRLQQKGLNPHIVLVPWDERYERALTDVPVWKRRCPLRGSVLPKWVTTVDGMQVFVWPHKDSECVGIIDISHFARFNEAEENKGDSLKISFRELTKNEIAEFLLREVRRRKRQEFKRWLRALEYDTAKAGEMKRIVEIQDCMQFELLDCNAGVKLVPFEEQMGIVYKEGESVYHLPECAEAQRIPRGERRYFKTLGLAELAKEFKPCRGCVL